MDIKNNFKQMPTFLKILFILNLISIVMNFTSLITIEKVPLSLFGTGFPENSPLIWHLINLSLIGFGTYVFLNRSYSLLKKYVLISVGMIVISILNSIYAYMNGIGETTILNLAIANGLVILILGLILNYLLRQKKYFNQA